MADVTFYFVSGKLGHRGMSSVSGSASLSETSQDVALPLPFCNPDLVFGLHFMIVVNNAGILPDFMTRRVQTQT